MSLKMEFEFDESVMRSLLQIPVLFRLKPAERILKAMARPIALKGEILAPSSIASGTRKKWGKKYKSNPAYQNSSGKSLGYAYRKTETGGYLMVGGMYPGANKLNFDSGESRKVFYWGKDAGKVKRIAPKDRFMQRAYDETKPAQITAGEAQLRKELAELRIT